MLRIVKRREESSEFLAFSFLASPPLLRLFSDTPVFPGDERWTISPAGLRANSILFLSRGCNTRASLSRRRDSRKSMTAVAIGTVIAAAGRAREDKRIQEDRRTRRRRQIFATHENECSGTRASEKLVVPPTRATRGRAARSRVRPHEQ